MWLTGSTSGLIHERLVSSGAASIRADTAAGYAAPMPGDQAASRDASERWRTLVRASAPAHLVDLEFQLLERLIDQFGVVPRPSATGARPHLNLYPPAGFGAARIGFLVYTTGRFYAMPDTPRPEVHLRAVPEGEVAEGKYLARYIRSEDDLDLAVRLLQCAFDDRSPAQGRPLQRKPRPPSPIRGTEPVEPVGTSEYPPNPAPAPPIDVPEEHRATARRIVESTIYQARLRAMPRGAPGDERAVEALAFLLARGGVAGFGSIAQVTGMATQRVQPFLSRLALLLAVDGLTLLTIDTDAQEARVEPALLVSQFGV